MELKWTKVEDGLPSSIGWYLTYSPNYWRGNAFTSREKCEGLVFSKFTISKNGSKGWSIETPMNSGVVKAWMPLPLPEWANPWTDVPFNATPGYPSAKLEAAADRDEEPQKTPRILRPVKRETVCTADGVFAGMSLDELVKIVAGIYADSEADYPMPLTERETGYLAVREAIRRLKVLDATPEKCRPEWLGGRKKEEL